MRTLSTFTADLTTEQRSRAFVQWLGCFHEARGAPLAATALYKTRYPGAHHDIVTRALDVLETKAAVLPGDTVTPAWGGALVAPQEFGDAFLALARSESLIGRIPRLRAAPFGVQVPVQTGGASYQWVAQGSPKPVSKFSFDDGVVLAATKAGAIIVETAELMKSSAPGAADALRDDLVAGLVEFTDTSFLDPAAAAVADTQPASITNGTTPVAGSGDIVADVAALLASFYADAPGGDPVLVMGGGPRSQLVGINTPAEEIVMSGAAGALGIIVALDPRRIVVADAGIAVDTSQYATLAMNSTPDDPVTAATVVVDLWQRNLVGLRVERTLNWYAAPDSVKYVALA